MSGYVGCQVRLGLLELRQEAVFEDVYFVGIDVDPLVDGSIPAVADLKHSRGADRSLDAQVPGFGVGLLDVRIEAIDARAANERVIRLGRRRLIGQRFISERRNRLPNRQAARRKRSRLSSVVCVQEEVLEVEGTKVRGVVPEVLAWLRKPPESKTTADYGAISTEQTLQRSLGDLWGPCKTKGRLRR